MQTEIQAAESLLPETGYFEVTVSINIWEYNLKNPPGIEPIPVDLI
jgi:hypothetical protein